MLLFSRTLTQQWFDQLFDNTGLFFLFFYPVPIMMNETLEYLENEKVFMILYCAQLVYGSYFLLRSCRVFF